MKTVVLRSLIADRVPSIDPAQFASEHFELWIPSYDGKPEELVGSAIGSSKKLVQPNDVLLSRIIPHIRRAWVVTPSNGARQLASSEWIVFRSPHVDPTYLRHFFLSDLFHAQFMQTVAGVGGSLLRARPEGVGAISVPLPSLDEQQRIATILDQADDLRRLRREAQLKFDALPPAIFVKMFGSGERHKAPYVSRLDKYLSFITSGGRNWSKYYSSAGSRFIRSLDVQMNHIGEEDIVFVNPPNNAEARRTRVQSGDVLLTITGSRIGRVASLPDKLADSYVSQHVAILRVNTDAILPQYLSFFLSLGSGGQRQIAKAQYGQTKPGLNFEQIRDFLAPIPPIEQQRAFLRNLVSIEVSRGVQRHHAAKLDSLFASLQHCAFRGKL